METPSTIPEGISGDDHERELFELLTLEGVQAGLSWSTILHKREGYRRAFEGFDPRTVAGFGDRDVERLLADPAGLVNDHLVTCFRHGEVARG